MNKLILDFLHELKENNDRDWFQAHKKDYENSRKLFEALVNDLIPSIREIDPTIDLITAKDCVFRIYRDVRFSGDKSPYKNNMGAYIARGGKKSLLAGYYVHAEPGESFLAGGIWMPPVESLKKIREEIYYNAAEFKNIIHHKNFEKYFNGFSDEYKLVNPPKGYSKDFADIDLLKYKSYAVVHMVPDELFVSAHYKEYALKVFEQLHILNEFLNRAIK